MSEISREFIRIKDEILSLSKDILEHLNEWENINFIKFNQDILSTQSKLSTLGSLSKNRPRNLGKFKNLANELISIAIEAKGAKGKGNPVEFAMKIGFLLGSTTRYLTDINSVLLNIS